MKRADRGNAVVEVALMAPWIFFLFLAIFDFGFYAYSAISVENAARVAALHTSSASGVANDSSTACFYVRQELKNSANVAGLLSCEAPPLQVTAQATCTNHGQVDVPTSQVTVTYQTDALFMLPYLNPTPWLPGRYSITRIVSMRGENNDSCQKK